MVALAEYIFVGLIVGFVYTYNSHMARRLDDEFITGGVFVYSSVLWPLSLFLLLMRFVGKLFNNYIFKQ